jgi:hypothetical protein
MKISFTWILIIQWNLFPFLSPISILNLTQSHNWKRCEQKIWTKQMNKKYEQIDNYFDNWKTQADCLFVWLNGALAQFRSYIRRRKWRRRNLNYKWHVDFFSLTNLNQIPKLFYIFLSWTRDTPSSSVAKPNGTVLISETVAIPI